MDLPSLHKSAVACLQLIEQHCINAKSFNLFCSRFLSFTEDLHKFLLEFAHCVNSDVIFLCLHQICTAIKFIELAMKAKEGQPSSFGHIQWTPIQHFLDRILLYSTRLCAALDNSVEAAIEDTFCHLMDMLLDYLEPFEADDNTKLNCKASSLEKFRSMIDEILSQTLTFANVALEEDKKAISALCQQVFRECISFQTECQLIGNDNKVKPNCKLIAASLTNALYKLEDHINRTFLRLIYKCFLDYEKYSIEKLRTMQLCGNIDEITMDEFIADFDVNLDRTTQLGVFASAFAPNVKSKAIICSSMASFEALDSFLIPAILSKPCEHLLTVDILEQHFNEEVNKFKDAIQQIIDSYAFTICYIEYIDQCLLLIEKEFCKNKLEDIIDMGRVLCEHFELKSNHAQLENNADLLQCFENFMLLLHECTAILVCCQQVDQQRIVKRFKILRSLLGKFIKLLQQSTTPQSITEDYELGKFDLAQIDSTSTRQNESEKPTQTLNEPPSTIPKFSIKPGVFRKDSLRRKIFKRKMDENIHGDSVCSSDQTSLMMSEILNQLTFLSTDADVAKNTN